jgi:acyl-ACP thioesterase
MMIQVSETDPDTRCFAKAKQRNQRTFTVVEQDCTAVPTIAYWILLNIETAPPEKLRQALEDCIAMRAFPAKKYAD